MKKFFDNVRKLSTGGLTSHHHHHHHHHSNFNIRRLSLSSVNSMPQIKLLRGGYNIDLQKVDNSFTKLHKAVYLNNEDRVKKYLTQINVNSLDNYNRSPLHFASVNGNLSIIKMLIKYGANVNYQDADGRSPLIKAIECGHNHVVRLLMDSGANVDLADYENGNTALHHCLLNANVDCAHYIIRNALIIDYNKRNLKKETFLHLAAKIPDLYSVIEELIANGIEIEAIDDLGRTAAQVAKLNDNMEAYRLIVRYVDAAKNQNNPHNDEELMANVIDNQTIIGINGKKLQHSNSTSHIIYDNIDQYNLQPIQSNNNNNNNNNKIDQRSLDISFRSQYRFSGFFDENDTIIEQQEFEGETVIPDVDHLKTEQKEKEQYLMNNNDQYAQPIKTINNKPSIITFQYDKSTTSSSLEEEQQQEEEEEHLYSNYEMTPSPPVPVPEMPTPTKTVLLLNKRNNNSNSNASDDTNQSDLDELIQKDLYRMDKMDFIIAKNLTTTTAAEQQQQTISNNQINNNGNLNEEIWNNKQQQQPATPTNNPLINSNNNKKRKSNNRRHHKGGSHHHHHNQHPLPESNGDSSSLTYSSSMSSSQTSPAKSLITNEQVMLSSNNSSPKPMVKSWAQIVATPSTNTNNNNQKNSTMFNDIAINNTIQSINNEIIVNKQTNGKFTRRNNSNRSSNRTNFKRGNQTNNTNNIMNNNQQQQQSQNLRKQSTNSIEEQLNIGKLIESNQNSVPNGSGVGGGGGGGWRNSNRKQTSPPLSSLPMQNCNEQKYLNLLNTLKNILDSATTSGDGVDNVTNDGSANNNCQPTIDELTICRQLNRIIYESRQKSIELEKNLNEIQLLKENLNQLQLKMDQNQLYCKELELKLSNVCNVNTNNNNEQQQQQQQQQKILIDFLNEQQNLKQKHYEQIIQEQFNENFTLKKRCHFLKELIQMYEFTNSNNKCNNNNNNNNEQDVNAMATTSKCIQQNNHQPYPLINQQQNQFQLNNLFNKFEERLCTYQEFNQKHLLKHIDDDIRLRTSYLVEQFQQELNNLKTFTSQLVAFGFASGMMNNNNNNNTAVIAGPSSSPPRDPQGSESPEPETLMRRRHSTQMANENKQEQQQQEQEQEQQVSNNNNNDKLSTSSTSNSSKLLSSTRKSYSLDDLHSANIIAQYHDDNNNNNNVKYYFNNNQNNNNNKQQRGYYNTTPTNKSSSKLLSNNSPIGGGRDVNGDDANHTQLLDANIDHSNSFSYKSKYFQSKINELRKQLGCAN